MNRFVTWLFLLLAVPTTLAMHKVYLSPFQSTGTMIERKASILTVPDAYGEVLLHKMVRSERLGDVQLLAGKALGLNVPNKLDGYTPTHLAALNGNAKIMQVLVKSGANLTMKSYFFKKSPYADHNTPLHLAAQNCFPDVVKELLTGLAPIEAQNKSSMRPLHLAVESGCSQVVRILLDAKANMGRIAFEIPLLHLSVINHHTEITKMLLEEGANPDEQTMLLDHPYEDWSVKTVMQIAVQTYQEETLELLINAKGNTSLPNAGYLHTPLHSLALLGAEKKYEKRIPFVLSLIKHDDKKIRRSEKKKTKKTNNFAKNKAKIKRMLDILTAADANPYAMDGEGLTPINLAIKYGNAYVFEVFYYNKILQEISDGMDGPWCNSLDVINEKLETSLTLATSYPNPMVAPLLRIQNKRHGLVLTEKEAERAMDAIMNDHFDDFIDKMQHLRVRDYRKFYKMAMEEYVHVRNVKFMKTLKNPKEIPKAFHIYMMNYIHVFYLVMKEYYPMYKRMMNEAINEARSVANNVEMEGIPYEGREEVDDFERTHIRGSMSEIINSMRHLEPVIGERIFQEEEAFVLTIIKNQVGCGLDDIIEFLKTIPKMTI